MPGARTDLGRDEVAEVAGGAGGRERPEMGQPHLMDEARYGFDARDAGADEDCGDDEQPGGAPGSLRAYEEGDAEGHSCQSIAEV